MTTFKSGDRVCIKNRTQQGTVSEEFESYHGSYHLWVRVFVDGYHGSSLYEHDELTLVNQSCLPDELFEVK